MALLAVFVDAMLDFVSGVVVMYTWKMRKLRDTARYPVGRSRLEPLGVIAIACLMTAATLVTFEQSIQTLVGGEQNSSLAGLNLTNASVLIVALLIKVALFTYCRSIPDASVSALAEDHWNDICANSISLTTVLVAQNAAWYLDPLAGIFISLLVIRNWLTHTLLHFDQLLGRVADPNILTQLTFLACNHHPDIKLVDTVRAYHVGTGIYAEIDIALAEDMPLRQAHDIGETLQQRIESIDVIERCFVHLDHETSHSPHQEHKQL